MMVSHPVLVPVFTHAASVMPVVRSSAAASGIVTESSTPSKDNALPLTPATRTAPDTVPTRPLADESIALPLASSKLRLRTGVGAAVGGGGVGVGGAVAVPP